MAEKAGQKCAELIQPEVSKQVWHLWRWFCELSQGATSNGFGANAMSWTDIKSWAELTCKTPTSWEISALRAIEKGYLNG